MKFSLRAITMTCVMCVATMFLVGKVYSAPISTTNLITTPEYSAEKLMELQLDSSDCGCKDKRHHDCGCKQKHNDCGCKHKHNDCGCKQKHDDCGCKDKSHHDCGCKHKPKDCECKHQPRDCECICTENPQKGCCEQSFVIKSVPVIIRAPGKYCVVNDLTYTGTGRAITVASDNVTLNFANHNLTLTQTSAVGVYAADIVELKIENDRILHNSISNNTQSTAIALFNVSKATIDNIYTQNTFFGIDIQNSNDIFITNSHLRNHVGGDSAAAINIHNSRSVTIDNVTTEGSSDENQFTSAAIRIFGSSELVSILNSKLLLNDFAINADQVIGLLVENVQATSSPSSIFNLVQLGTAAPTGAHDVIIRDSTFTNRSAVSGFDGLLFISGSGALVENVVVDTNTSASNGYVPGAIHIGCISTNSGCNPSLRFDDVIIRDTIVSNINDVGIFLEGGSNIVIENTLVSDSRAANIRLDDVIDSTIKNSDINRGDGFGILLNAGANGNEIFANSVNDNNVGIQVNLGALTNSLINNHVFNNGGIGINNLDATTITFFNTSCGNGGASCVGVTPSQAPGASPAVAGSNVCCP